MGHDDGHRLSCGDELGADLPSTDSAGVRASLLARWNLTNKDVEVLDLLVAFNSNKVIGSKLGLSESTVEARLRAIKTKLGSRDRNDTARIYAALLKDQGKTLEGFPEISDRPWPDLNEQRVRRLPDPLFLNDASPFGDDAARRTRGGLWLYLGALPDRLSLPALVLLIAVIAGLLGLTFLAVLALVRDLANNGLPSFLT